MTGALKAESAGSFKREVRGHGVSLLPIGPGAFTNVFHPEFSVVLPCWLPPSLFSSVQ